MNEITINDICENRFIIYKAPYCFINSNGECEISKKLKIEK